MSYSSYKISLLLLVILSVGFAGCRREKARPNILFAILDDATYSHFGAYGSDWVHTPNFDRVAGSGILFTRAYTPNAKCAPSRSSILTGRNSWQLEAAANHWCYFPEKFRTFPEVLSDAGFHVGFTGKGWAPGVPGTVDGQPRELLGRRYNGRRLEAPTSGIRPLDYAGNLVDFLDARTGEQPFFFWFGSYEPHRPYEFGSGIRKGGKKRSDITETYASWPENDTVQSDLLDYAYEIEYFDRQLGLMLDELEDRGMLGNTLVVVTSDNGMPFPRIKGQEYELSNHMPLAVMWPEGIAAPGRKIDDFVSFIDLAPTFLELAGIHPQQGGMQPVEGKSLTNLMFSAEYGQIDPARDHVLIGKERHDVGRPGDAGYPIRGIVKGDFLLVRNFEPDRWPAGDPVTGYLNCDGSPTKTVVLQSGSNPETFRYWSWSFGKRGRLELYNIITDPECLNNLAAEEKYQPILSALHEQMEAELEEQADPRILGRGEVFDRYAYADTSTVNFYERYLKGEKLNSGWVNPSDFQDIPELATHRGRTPK